MVAPRILLVEDELIIAKGIERRLRALGYAVAGAAASGPEAVERAAELLPDLVLMDINLGGGMDGVEAATRIGRQADVPVVYLTAHSDEATLQRAKLTEPHGYVLKPFEDSDLHAAIVVGMYRHKMTRRLRENERWLAATLGSIGDGVIATNGRGAVRFMNALAEGLTGWAEGDAHGSDVRDVFHVVHRHTRRPVANPALEALATGRPATLAPDTVLVSRAGSETPIDDSAAPIVGEDGATDGAVLVFRDVTERLRLEETLRQAQKLEAVGMLAGGIAHDFNNMLTVINGYSELLLAGGVSEADRDGYLRNIHDAGRRAAALTQQLTAFSRKQLLKPVVLCLNDVVRDIGSMVRRLIGEDIEFVTHLAADLGNTLADPSQVSQIVLNLAANARDAMPTGGRLTVSTAGVVLGPPDARPGRYVRLAVEDTGTGMPADVRDRVFDPFFTTKEVGKGTGLGLATVYGIVRQSGGHVEVASEVGRGTVFRVYLPVVDEAVSAPPADAPAAPAGHETVLVVEDEETVRLLLRTVLEQAGYRVLEAADGEAGVAVAAGHAGPVHLLITDLVMPKLSGREVAERIRAAKPGLRTLYVSGYTDEVFLRQGVEASAVDFLHKPFTFADLALKVREVLDRPPR